MNVQKETVPNKRTLSKSVFGCIGIRLEQILN